jgi:hypothetical protein
MIYRSAIRKAQGARRRRKRKDHPPREARGAFGFVFVLVPVAAAAATAAHCALRTAHDTRLRLRLRTRRDVRRSAARRGQQFACACASAPAPAASCGWALKQLKPKPGCRPQPNRRHRAIIQDTGRSTRSTQSPGPEPPRHHAYRAQHTQHTEPWARAPSPSRSSRCPEAREERSADARGATSFARAVSRRTPAPPVCVLLCSLRPSLRCLPALFSASSQHT